MEEHRFDDFARTLARPASRRTLIAGWLAAISAIAGLRSARSAPPACAIGSPCARTADCCPTERCVEGVCESVPGREHAHCHAVTCPVSADPCSTFVCNPQTGECDLVPNTANDGAPCPGTDACFQAHVCQAGVCTGLDPVDCSVPPDACHTAGTCDPAGGTCAYPPVHCGANEVCEDGACVCAEGLVRCGDECLPCCPHGTIRPYSDRNDMTSICCSQFAHCTSTAAGEFCECTCWPTGSYAYCPAEPANPAACCSGECDGSDRCACSAPGEFCNPVTQGGTPCCSGTCVPLEGRRYTGMCSTT